MWTIVLLACTSVNTCVGITTPYGFSNIPIFDSKAACVSAGEEVLDLMEGQPLVFLDYRCTNWTDKEV